MLFTRYCYLHFFPIAFYSLLFTHCSNRILLIAVWYYFPRSPTADCAATAWLHPTFKATIVTLLLPICPIPIAHRIACKLQLILFCQRFYCCYLPIVPSASYLFLYSVRYGPESGRVGCAATAYRGFFKSIIVQKWTSCTWNRIKVMPLKHYW